MKLKLFILIAIVALAFSATASAEIVAGGNLGLDIKNFRDPGATLMYGAQSDLTDNHRVRVFVQKVNWGNGHLDNVAFVDIWYLGSYFGFTGDWDFGTRISLDYEFDDGDVGQMVGLEITRKNIEFIPLGYTVAICASMDIVGRPDIVGTYFNAGLCFVIGKL